MGMSWSSTPKGSDLSELFHNGNDRGIETQVKPDSSGQTTAIGGLPVLDVVRCDIAILRGTNTFTCKLGVHDREPKSALPRGYSLRDNQDTIIMSGMQIVASIEGLLQAFRTLKSTVYIGPFRNAINIGTNDNYYDIHVGQAFIKTWKTFKS